MKKTSSQLQQVYTCRHKYHMQVHEIHEKSFVQLVFIPSLFKLVPDHEADITKVVWL